MPDRNDKAFQEFLSEAQEIVESLARDLGVLEAQRQAGQRDPDVVNSAFRAVHSLKGVAGLFALTAMSQVAHTLENLLDRIRLGKSELGGSVMDLLFEAVEIFARQVADLSAGQPLDENRAGEFLVRLDVATAERVEVGPPGLGGYQLDPSIIGVLTEYEEHRLKDSIRAGKLLYRVRIAFDLMAIENGLEDLKRKIKPVGEVLSYLPSADMRADNAIELDVLVASSSTPVAVEDAIVGMGATVHPVPRIGGQPRVTPPLPRPSIPPPIDSFARATPSHTVIDKTPPAKPEPRDEDASSDGNLRSVTRTVRVDIRKLDHLMNVVGELSLARASITRVLDDLRAISVPAELTQRLSRESRSLERRIDELQAGILEVRMVPLGQVFDKLGRLVRKISRDAGKEVLLTIHGAETELDKLIVEELSDPLMHIIRNAIDHGIEDEATRRRAGKPAAGTLSVSASQKGNHVIIVIADDGGGFDEEKILEIALKRGLIDAASATELSRRDLLNLVFLPGFSTRDVASELSGRGVGMDVVKTNIARLSGLIDVRSRRGQGTEIAITLPITLAVIQALIIKSAARTYAMPLGSVLESLGLEDQDLATIEGREVLSLRGQTLPLVRLDQFFQLSRQEPSPRSYVVVVGLAQHRVGLVVDELIGQEDVVVKSLGKALAAVSGVSGAAELGGHETVLVLDVAAIVEEALDVSAAEAA